jgi:hypothetical protein
MYFPFRLTVIISPNFINQENPSNSNFDHTNDMKPLFYYIAFLCAEGARHISPGQRPGFDTPYAAL